MDKLIQQLSELGITREQHNQAVKAWLRACDEQGSLVPFYPFLEAAKA